MSWLVRGYESLLLSAVVTAALIVLFRVLAQKVGLLDQPNHRKIHQKPIPLVGGVSLFATLSVWHQFFGSPHPFVSYLLLASLLVVGIGLIDDKLNISPFWRFLAQIVACLIVIVFAEVKIDSFGELLWMGHELSLWYFAIPVTVFGVVGIINSLNMTDGIDGLAATTFAIPLIFLAGLQTNPEMQGWLLSLVVSVLVFMGFNLSRRMKIFLGDHGSLFLGFVLSWLLVFESQGKAASILPVTALYLVAPALYDTIFVMIRRIKNKVSPFKADNTHIHHLLLARGWSQPWVLMFMAGLIVVSCTVAYLLMKYEVAESLQFYLFVTVSAVYYLLMSHLWEKVKND